MAEGYKTQWRNIQWPIKNKEQKLAAEHSVEFFFTLSTMWSEALLLYTWWMSDLLSRPYTLTLYCFIGLLLVTFFLLLLFFGFRSSFTFLSSFLLLFDYYCYFLIDLWECFIYVGNHLPLLCAMLWVPVSRCHRPFSVRMFQSHTNYHITKITLFNCKK